MSIQTSYRDLIGGAWLRGNLHAHTTKSDGRQDVQTVINEYAARGYDFLMISDHDICMSRQEYEQFDNKGMVLIPGNEVSVKGPHLLHVNANQRVEPREDRQLVLDEISERGGFAVINHPSWSTGDPDANWTHVTQEMFRRWRGYAGIEIYNGVIGELRGSPYAVDRWDRLLTTGFRTWGFANDDSHAANHIGLGWNVVYARERTVEAIVEAMLAGRFYASTGVVISKIELNGDTVRIETENADRIVAMATGQRRFAVVDARHIEVKVPENEKYVRFECWGRGEQFAWTQPFYIGGDSAP